MEKNHNYSQIEHYVNGKLSKLEKKQFEAQIQLDKELAEEVAFYESLQLAVEKSEDESVALWLSDTESTLEKEGFFDQEKKWNKSEEKSPSKKLEIVHKKKKKTTISRKLFPKLAIAASILLLVSVISVLWLSKPFSNEALVAKHFGDTHITNIATRSSSVTTNDLKEGLTLMEQNNGVEAIEFFEAIPDSLDAFYQARLFLAALQLEQQDYQQAKTNAQLVINNTTVLKQQGQWLLLQILLSSGQTDQTFEQLLDALANDDTDPFYQRKAIQLKNDWEDR